MGRASYSTHQEYFTKASSKITFGMVTGNYFFYIGFCQSMEKLYFLEIGKETRSAEMERLKIFIYFIGQTYLQIQDSQHSFDKLGTMASLKRTGFMETERSL
jgi:hypothetical protein